MSAAGTPARPRCALPVKCAEAAPGSLLPGEPGAARSRRAAMIHIREASSGDLPVLGRLFDEYRQFYKLPSEVGKASAYLKARLGAGDSVVLVAAGEGEQLIGFTQLYPTWCSLLAGPVYVLYDLYVAPEARQRGVGR